MPITFHSIDTPYLPKARRALRQWLSHCIAAKGFEIGDIACIFCSDEHLLQLNREHLQHDYLTDIITFDYTEEGVLSGDLFISIDRVRDNARALRINTTDEVHRVIIHGLLHLMGYRDKTPAEQHEMRAQEDSCLTLR
jgi:rRNA maturation RNase YbeY